MGADLGGMHDLIAYKNLAERLEKGDESYV